MKWHHVLAIAATGVPLFAQVTPPAAEPAPAPSEVRRDERVEQRAQSMREQLVNGRTVQSHVRVSVRLKNGNKLVGVVKDGRLVERVDGLRFVDAQARERGAGIRLWYAHGARNYVFVPFLDFAEYEVLQRLSPKQIEEIELEMQMEERRAAERAAAAAQRAKAAAKPVEPGGTGDAPPAPGPEPAPDASAAAAKEQHRQWFQLLQTYPPDDGWNAARRDEIKRRFVVIGVRPNELEQQFVDKFAEWEQACQHFEVGAKPGATGGDGAEGVGKGKGKPDDRKDRRRGR